MGQFQSFLGVFLVIQKPEFQCDSQGTFKKLIRGLVGNAPLACRNGK